MFIRRFELFRIFGFPIRIDLSWFIIVALITWSLAEHLFPNLNDSLTTTAYWTMGFAGAIGLFVSVLLHELGHAVVARRCGMRMNGITLFIFGGVAEMQDEPPSAKDEFLVAIGGPVVSVALIGVFAIAAGILGFAGAHESLTLVAGWLAWINLILVVFNMIPAFPLDGGRVLRSILWQWRGSLRWATKITAAIGAGFGLFLILMGVYLLIFHMLLIAGFWWIIIGMFLRSAANMSYQQVLIRRALEGEPVGQFMKTEPVTVEPNLTVDRLVSDYFYRHYHKMYPVLDGDRLVGCVTSREVKSLEPEQWPNMRVAEIAQPCSNENTIQANTDAMEAMSRMSRNESSRLMVVDGDRLVGIIALKDLLRFLSLKVELNDERTSQ